jgi:hypothetical protein
MFETRPSNDIGGGDDTGEPVQSPRSQWLAFGFAVFLYVTWVGAWLAERAVEPNVRWIATAPGQFAYWLRMF